MKCESCGKATLVNYGNSVHVLCKRCAESESGRESLNKPLPRTNLSDHDVKQMLKSPLLIGAGVTLGALAISLLLQKASGIPFFIWGGFMLLGVVAASAAMITQALKGLRKSDIAEDEKHDTAQ